jgi:hypothetical protein
LDFLNYSHACHPPTDIPSRNTAELLQSKAWTLAAHRTKMARKQKHKTRKERKKEATRDAKILSTPALWTHEVAGISALPDEFDFAQLRYYCAECGARDKQSCTLCVCEQINYCGKTCQRAAWKRIHKRVCGNTIGFPTIEKLKQANFHQLSIATNEWCGGCPTIMSSVSPVLTRSPSLVITADPRDLANMASSIARVLDANDPSDTVSTSHTSALLLAGCIMAILDERGDVAIATTTLLESTIRYFLALAPLFADCEYKEDGTYKNPMLAQSLISAFTNQLTDRSYSWCAADLQKCAALTATAMGDCAEAIVQGNRRTITVGDADSPRVIRAYQEAKLKKLHAKGLQDFSIPKELRLLLRNLTFLGFAPPESDLTSKFIADYEVCSKADDTILEMISTWGQVASNLSGKCGIQASQLKQEINRTAMSKLGGIMQFVDVSPKSEAAMVHEVFHIITCDHSTKEDVSRPYNCTVS